MVPVPRSRKLLEAQLAALTYLHLLTCTFLPVPHYLYLTTGTSLPAPCFRNLDAGILIPVATYRQESPDTKVPEPQYPYLGTGTNNANPMRPSTTRNRACLQTARQSPCKPPKRTFVHEAYLRHILGTYDAGTTNWESATAPNQNFSRVRIRLGSGTSVQAPRLRNLMPDTITPSTLVPVP